MTSTDYEISLDPQRVQIDVVHGYLRQSYWSERVRREIVETAIANSVVAGAYLLDSGAQVSFARAVTDYATFAWLADVFVLAPHRGKGLARGMVQALLAHPRLQTLRRWCLATADAQGLYSRLGFALVEGRRWMELRPPGQAWQD